jgi:hypothetical protein
VSDIAIWVYTADMKLLSVVLLVLLIPLAVAAQQRKTPVAVGHTGKDEVGSLFVDALNREIAQSGHYEPMGKTEKGFRFYVGLITVDAAETTSDQAKRSVVSVVIEDMGLPNSFPVPDMWYHKVIVVDRRAVDETAKQLLEDMDARWCNYIKNSVGGCPAEKFEPKL